MSYEWIACEAMTGRYIADLPGLTVPKIGAALCDFWTSSGTFATPSAPRQVWRRALMPFGSYVVLIDTDTAMPVWGGWVTSLRSSAADTVEVGLATWEAFLARRYLAIEGTATFTQELTNVIAGQLLWVQNIPLWQMPAHQIGLAASVHRHDRTYRSDEDKTVLDVWQELAGIQDGYEFTASWTHLTAPDRWMPVIEGADRIGSAVQPGYAPAAVFDMPGCVSSFTLTEDWTAGKAATDVMAVSSATGDVRPESSHHQAVDVDRPRLEYRFTPSTSIARVSTLDGHAERALQIMRDGATALELTAAVDAAPRLGVDWRIGDDIAYSLSAPSVSELDADGQLIPASGVGRCVGWEMTLDGVPMITPVLADTEVV